MNWDRCTATAADRPLIWPRQMCPVRTTPATSGLRSRYLRHCSGRGIFHAGINFMPARVSHVIKRPSTTFCSIKCPPTQQRKSHKKWAPSRARYFSLVSFAALCSCRSDQDAVGVVRRSKPSPPQQLRASNMKLSQVARNCGIAARPEWLTEVSHHRLRLPSRVPLLRPHFTNAPTSTLPWCILPRAACRSWYVRSSRCQ